MQALHRGMVAAACLWPAWAQAEPAIVRAESQTQTVDCGGDVARVEGNRNTLTFLGACRSLDVMGDGNRITVELRPNARVHVEGQKNQVGFTTVRGGGAPQISVAGVDSVVTPVGAAPAPAPAAAQAVAAAAPTTPATAPATTSVVPSTVQDATPRAGAAPSGRTSPPPASPGMAVPANSPPGPAPGPVALRGNDQQREANCAGGAALIEGDRGSYVLRGACKSLAVRGHVAIVQAELAPRAIVTVEGSGTVLYWVQGGNGPAPQITLRGEGNRAIKVARLPL